MKFWYQSKFHIFALLLLPLSLLVWIVSSLKIRRRSSGQYPIPVVVVGNITVGGTGKTPTIIWLVSLLKAAGIAPAVVSRGYGAKPNRDYPVSLRQTDPAHQVGDEPRLIQDKTGVPVVIDPLRDRAVRYLCGLSAKERPDVIISDDGLQHYAMSRDLELIMVDPERGLGNGYFLPAGPLRESRRRLSMADFILAKSPGDALATLQAKVQSARQLQSFALNVMNTTLTPQKVTAVSAIGHPHSFYKTLETQGYIVAEQFEYPDHATIPKDILTSASYPVVVTEKDWVKANKWPENVYRLPFNLAYDDEFADELLNKIKDLIQ